MLNFQGVIQVELRRNRRSLVVLSLLYARKFSAIHLAVRVCSAEINSLHGCCNLGKGSISIVVDLVLFALATMMVIQRHCSAMAVVLMRLSSCGSLFLPQ